MSQQPTMEQVSKNPAVLGAQYVRETKHQTFSVPRPNQQYKIETTGLQINIFGRYAI